ncbi:hypothetical protein RJ640_001438, partial [Escallonia rubra]
HLYTALVQAGLSVFRDDDEIERGKNLKCELDKAIEGSQVAIIVFSKDYSSSEWCLDELSMILAWKNTSRHIVFHVFYDVEPSKFIQKIVSVTQEKLNRRVLSVPQYQVGMDSLVQNIHLWLQDGSSNANILVIYGMGGIGKTVIAKIAYNLNFHRFDSSSFVAYVNQLSKQPNYILELQNQVLSNILKGEKGRLYNVDKGSIKIYQAICSKRVLVVLDDVDKPEQFDALLGTRVFYPGSKIIITTRNIGLLRDLPAHKAHEIQVCPRKSNSSLSQEQSKRLVRRCKGLPLALQVLGSSLFRRSIDIWEDELSKQEKKHLILTSKKSWKEAFILRVTMTKTYSSISLASSLERKKMTQLRYLKCCLLTVEGNKLMMHQLIQEMGKEIVDKESPKEPERRSRLWRHKDSFHYLGFLKTLDLSHSERLARTFNFLRLPNLEKLILKDCVGLLEVCESIEFIKELVL